ncbi:Bifunctional solanapyrone synthase [Cyphellophora attinorum]|uniref:Bifunctional solanapyrone synthase n=1 Tax=Cyphellophora attinorum TaxID=1664694 RepID=A0A0N1H4M1_9EURO|nr:Bifunctional solanapyrone synthase [Phialophora attinorum]KPI37037.1 Bifunctional solanapyrone synthase [Phialophora attinorum]
MRYVLYVTAALALGAQALLPEAPDSSVLQALRNQGVKTEELPVAELLSRSPNSGCAAAVGHPFLLFAYALTFQCASLHTLYRSDSLQDNVTACTEFSNGYWSTQQAEADPYCIFKAPHSASISTAILLARLYRCPFAVKSGGHAAFPGASNINNGITISLERLNTLQIAPDRKTVAVGAGMRWGSVYSTLEPSNLAVIGGRVSSIGVGGLTLGGGISFLSNLHGWACDNVVSYEIILASGISTTASATKNPDLYWALRGGGNNFGIVTKFHYEAHSLPGHNMWGGSRLYTEAAFPQLTNAFHNVITNSYTDPKAGTWIAWIYMNNTKMASTELWYAGPEGDSAPIWKEYNSLTPPPISDTTSPLKLANYTRILDAANPYGLRETFYGITFKLSLEMLHITRDIFFNEVRSVANVTGVAPIMLFQGITSEQVNHMAKRGGNPLGVGEPLYLVHLSPWWELAEDDGRMYAMISRLLERVKAEAKKRGPDSDYLYMNYAGLYQDVIRGYGRENQRKLVQIAKKYDPQGVFQKLQPGYFKLEDGAPVKDGRYFSG